MRIRHLHAPKVDYQTAFVPKRTIFSPNRAVGISSVSFVLFVSKTSVPRRTEIGKIYRNLRRGGEALAAKGTLGGQETGETLEVTIQWLKPNKSAQGV
jgi:hypothetical protein